MNWNKYFEPFMWVVCAIAIIALILTDPIAVAFLLENILVICLWALSVAVTATICFLCGYRKGKSIGTAEGFRNGEKWGKGVW